MKKSLLILLLIFILSLTACVKESDEDDKGPYKYDLTIYNVTDFIVVSIKEINVKLENFVQYEINIEVNIDDDEGEPTSLLMIAFEIDVDIVFSFTNEENETVYLEKNFSNGFGAEGKDKIITINEQIVFDEYSLENTEIFFDSLRWNKVKGYVILKDKYNQKAEEQSSPLLFSSFF